MEASKGRRRRASSRLWKVLEAAQSARDAEDQVVTDRDGELLPDPTDHLAGEQSAVRRPARGSLQPSVPSDNES
jgi:hypothetical protein